MTPHTPGLLDAPGDGRRVRAVSPTTLGTTLPLAQESSALARRIGQLRRTLHQEIAQIADGCGVEASPGAGASTDRGVPAAALASTPTIDLKGLLR